MLKENFQSLKKILRTTLRPGGLFTISLVGKVYKVCYEASHYREERDYAVIKALARDKRCILDIGANVGTSTLLLAENNQASIYAFEASEFASTIVRQNMAANGLADRVTVINALVGDKSGGIIPFYWALSSGGASIFKGRLGHDLMINKVSLALDDYVRINNLRPDLLKIDVEGAELMVLNGTLTTMRSNKPVIFLELHAVEGIPLWENAVNILDTIKACNYKMIYLRTKREVIDGTELKDRGRCHVLLLNEHHDIEGTLNNLDTAGL